MDFASFGVGVLTGLVATGLLWLLKVQILKPTIQVAAWVSRRSLSRAGRDVTYYVAKFKNAGRRGVLDLSVAASIRLEGHVIAVVCSTQSIEELKRRESRRVFMRLELSSDADLILPSEIRSKCQDSENIGVLLASYPNARLVLNISGDDALSRTRRKFKQLFDGTRVTTKKFRRGNSLELAETRG
jgi:hypothetical protein